METRNRLYKTYVDAKKLFADFGLELLDDWQLQTELIRLIVQDMDTAPCEKVFWIEELCSQFTDYREDRITNAFLVSLKSSGSILTQFDVNDRLEAMGIEN